MALNTDSRIFIKVRWNLDHYIVKIYRREKGDPHHIVGMVKDVKNDRQRSFSHIDELIQVFCFPDFCSYDEESLPLPGQETN